MLNKDKKTISQAKRLLENYGQRFCLGIKEWFDELFDGYLGEKACKVLWF